MSSRLLRLWGLLDAQERRAAMVLLSFMVIAAALEACGVVIVPAFVAAVVDPARLSDVPLAGDAFAELASWSRERVIVAGSAVLLVVFGAKATFMVLNAGLQTRFVTNRRVTLARRLVHAYVGAPHAFHLGRNSAELLRNVEKETAIVAYQVMGAALEIATRLFVLTGVLVPLLIIEPVLTLGWFTVFGGIGAFAAARFAGRLKAAGSVEQHERQNVARTLAEGVGSLKEARVTGRAGHLGARIVTSLERMSAAMRFKQFASAAIPPVTEYVAVVGLLAIVGALLALGRTADEVLVVLSLFAVGLVRLREAVSALLGHLANLRYNLVAVDPIADDLAELERAPRPPATPLLLAHEIRLERAGFDYAAADGRTGTAVDDIDLAIPAGSVVGIVGPTGAGKSTLVDIVLGILPPTRGRLLVDGVDVHAHGVDGWQRSLGYVPQSIFLLDDSIRRNVALAVPDDEIDDARVTAALEAARLDAFVARQPDGLGTPVGERGARLSGGERQRLGIARALYDDPAVLVLDEATSALDGATEREVVAAVERLRGSRTIIMIAHRLSTVRRCDRLYWLEAGRIEASGTFAELEDRHAGFRTMARAS